jgi:hypothetical protein
MIGMLPDELITPAGSRLREATQFWRKMFLQGVARRLNYTLFMLNDRMKHSVTGMA